MTKQPTTKEQIIDLVQDKPFLTMKEIAEELYTTEDYVRSVIYKSDLSLRELRREKAKKLYKDNKKLTRKVYRLKKEVQDVNAE